MKPPWSFLSQPPLHTGSHAGLSWTWWGTWPYPDCHQAQQNYRTQRIADSVPDALWLLEHPPVITTGRRHVLPPTLPDPYTHISTERGGLATCHEPGQLVCYLLINASDLGPKKLVSTIETALVRFLHRFNILAFPRSGFPGVWVQPPHHPLSKIAAIGLHIEHGCTLHGLAINLTNTLEGFRYITPCGLTDTGITSLSRLIANAPTPEEAASDLAHDLAHALAHARSEISFFP